MVPMRWNAAGTTETGFRKKCFAVVDWVHPIPLFEGDEADVKFGGEYEGKRVRSQELLKILDARARIAARRRRRD
jgi:hypothetical protein